MTRALALSHYSGLNCYSALGKRYNFRHITCLKLAPSARVVDTDHNVRETLDICETAYIVNDGQLIAEGDAQTILANQLVKEVYLGHEFRL